MVARQRDDLTSDRELLRRFAVLRDAEAFAALFRRHGAMVLGVAARVLHLDSDQFDVRVAAHDELRALGNDARPALRAARQASATLETRRRFLWPRPSAITAENTARIRDGMTLDEVEAILGGPAQ